MPASPLLLDTSVAIAICSADHPLHQAAIQAVGNHPIGLAGHAWFETFSVLTRLPIPHRRSGRDASRLLGTNFPHSKFVNAAQQQKFTRELEAGAIVGGAVYDALVAFAARETGSTLLTGDERAGLTYTKVGVDFRLIG